MADNTLPPEENEAEGDEQAADDELRLLPVETKSYEEARVEFLKDWFAAGEKLPEPEPEPVRWQFSISDCLLVLFGVALAFVGFSGEPSRLRATLLALLLVALMVVPLWIDADGRVWRALWLILLTAYAIAALLVLIQAP